MARKLTEGIPSAGRFLKSGHQVAAKGMQFPWRWDGGTISTNLDIIWEMSVKSWVRRQSGTAQSDEQAKCWRRKLKARVT